ncbi:hypothetical protein ACE3NQ_10485, partial [Paenibacillus terreus]
YLFSLYSFPWALSPPYPLNKRDNHAKLYEEATGNRQQTTSNSNRQQATGNRQQTTSNSNR